MKFSESWLRDWINPPLNTDELGSALTQIGLEVDKLEMQGKEALFTLKVSPNRGDCLSLEGISRELSLLTDIKTKQLKETIIPIGFPESLPVTVVTIQACPYYLGRLLKNIRPNLSTPDWMKNRLEQAGVASLSLIVDITNYVMLELGQPLHAFDAKHLQSPLCVRFAQAGETLSLLDNQELTLHKDDLVIADKLGPKALAGVMGGLDSAVSLSTDTIFLECAYFNPLNVRKMVNRYQIHTEASHRFERGIDRELAMRALERATELLSELAGALPGSITIVDNRCTLPLFSIKPIILRRNRLEKILGFVIPDSTIFTILEKLAFNPKASNVGWEIIPPSHRLDITEEIEVIEDVARIYGLQKLPSLKPHALFEYPQVSYTASLEQRLKQNLTVLGYSEAITYSFIDPKLLEQLSPRVPYLRVANPISEDMVAMRVSLWPGLIKAALYNINRQQTSVRLFEIGNCFFSSELSGQITKISGICIGSVMPEQWGEKARALDFFDLKGQVEALFEVCNLPGKIEYRVDTHPSLHPGQMAALYYQNQAIGFLGAMHPKLLKDLDFKSPVFLFEVDLASIQIKPNIHCQAISKFPSIRRDLAIVLDKTILVDAIKSAILGIGESSLREVEVFDVYQGVSLDPHKKSLALRFMLQHTDRTLTETDVKAIMDKVIALLTDLFQAHLRS